MADEGSSNGSNVVAIFAIVILAALAIVFVMYVMPGLRGGQQQAPDSPAINVQVDLPSGDGGQQGGEAPEGGN